MRVIRLTKAIFLVVRSSSSDVISPGYFHYARPSDEDALGTLEFVELCECGLPLLPPESFHEDEVIEPTPTVGQYSSSSGWKRTYVSHQLFIVRHWKKFPPGLLAPLAKLMKICQDS